MKKKLFYTLFLKIFYRFILMFLLVDIAVYFHIDSGLTCIFFWLSGPNGHMKYCHHLISVAGVCKPLLFWSPISIILRKTWHEWWQGVYFAKLLYDSDQKFNMDARPILRSDCIKLKGKNPPRICLKDWSVLYM